MYCFISEIEKRENMEITDGLKIGIDFGTCYIKVASWNKKKKRPKRLSLDKKQEDSDCRLSNTILYQKNEDGSLDIVIGDEDGCRLEPDNSVRNIKYYLQKKEWEKYIPNLSKNVNVDDVLQELFNYIKNTIEEQNGGKKIAETIITMPVCFSEIQKEKILVAAKKIELPIKSIISEPLAALFSIVDNLNDNSDNIVLVFDFGGATLDLNLAKVNKKGDKLKVELLASSGLIYGGIDINHDLYNNVFLSKYPEVDKFISGHKQHDNVKKDFLDSTEKIKRMLSKNDVAEREWRPYTGEKICVDIKLEYVEFVSMLKELKRDKEILNVIDELLEQGSISKSGISHLIMVGGSSRINYFKELVTDYLNIEAMDLDEDDMYSAVSEGAVKYLSLMDDSNLEINNKLSYSIGISNKDNNFILQIKKGARYGYKGRKTKPSIVDGKIVVYQTFSECNNIDISTNESIVYMGYFDISKYVNIVKKMFVTFNVNKNGELQLKVFDKSDECATLDIIMR